MKTITKKITIECYFCNKPYEITVDYYVMPLTKSIAITGHDRIFCPHCHADVPSGTKSLNLIMKELKDENSIHPS